MNFRFRSLAPAHVSSCQALTPLVLLVASIFSSASLCRAQATWQKQTTHTAPSPRCCMGSAYIPALDGVVFFGGGDGITDYNDTWLWTSHWTQLSPSTVPAIRSGAGMAYDTTLGKIVMFGGRNDSESAVLNDTWIFDGSNWTQLFPATPPPGRAFDVPGMTYDSAQGNVMFFGGAGFGVYFDDTWTFDGTNWTQQFPATSPSTRRAPQVYDPATGTVILFGGDGPDGVTFDDTWSWDGSNWTRKFPPTSPGARTLAQMAFDAAANRLVLFGGADAGNVTGAFNDTWFYDGTMWSELDELNLPANRFAGLMTYQTFTRDLVLFSGYGYGEPSPRTDTWLFVP